MNINLHRALYIPFVSAAVFGGATLCPASADPAVTSAPPAQAAAATVKAIVPVAAAPNSSVKAVIPASAAAPLKTEKVLLTTGVVLPATAVKTVEVVPVKPNTRRVRTLIDQNLRYRSYAQWSTLQTSDSIKSR